MSGEVNSEYIKKALARDEPIKDIVVTRTFECVKCKNKKTQFLEVRLV
jgi:hypothetical protein